MLAAKPKDLGPDGKSCTIMALLDGGMLRRHKSWLKVVNLLLIFLCASSFHVCVCVLCAWSYFSLLSVRTSYLT